MVSSRRLYISVYDAMLVHSSKSLKQRPEVNLHVKDAHTPVVHLTSVSKDRVMGGCEFIRENLDDKNGAGQPRLDLGVERQ